MSRRIFWLLDLDGECIHAVLSADSPRAAALIAATRHHRDICLVDPRGGKVHQFLGQRVPLGQRDAYAERRNITEKPVVRKIAYKKVRADLTEDDVGELARVLRVS
jgi:hypothetical protein